MSTSACELLLHILDETYYLPSAADQLSQDTFLSAPALKWAFARSLEIIGEALQSRPSLVMDEQPQLEWRPIARMRDRLIHHDLGIDDEMVWGVVTSKVSELDRAPRACFEAIDLCRGESTSRSGAHRL